MVSGRGCFGNPFFLYKPSDNCFMPSAITVEYEFTKYGKTLEHLIEGGGKMG
jgi:hypothetical protein